MELPVPIRRFLYSRTALIISGVICAFIFFQLVNLVTRGMETDSQIRTLRSEVEHLEEEQKRLELLKSFLKTDYFAEREARTKYGLQKSGEKAVIISNGSGVVSATDSLLEQQHKKQPSISKSGEVRAEAVSDAAEIKNYQLWLKYFFDF